MQPPAPACLRLLLDQLLAALCSQPALAATKLANCLRDHQLSYLRLRQQELRLKDVLLCQQPRGAVLHQVGAVPVHVLAQRHDLFSQRSGSAAAQHVVDDRKAAEPQVLAHLTRVEGGGRGGRPSEQKHGMPLRCIKGCMPGG